MRFNAKAQKETSAPPIILDDAYGNGEMLFARKFSDAAQEIVARIGG